MSLNDQTNGYVVNAYADTFDVRASLRNIYRACRHHKALVLVTCLLTLGLVTLYIYLWPPIFRAEATLMAERDIDGSRDSFYGGWNVFRKDDLQTEMELVKSGPILKQLIDKEHLTYDQVYHPFWSHLAYLWQTSAVGKAYHRVKRKLLPDPYLDSLSPSEIDFGRTIGDMRDGISMEPVGEASIAKLTVKGPSRQVAQAANDLADIYMSSRTDRHFLEAQSSYDILGQEVARSAKELNEVSNRKLAYAQEHGITFDFQKENLQVGKLGELELGIANERAKIANSEASLLEVEKQLTEQPPTKTSTMNFELNTIRESMKSKRMDLQTALIGARNHYREDSPEVQEIQSDIAKLDALIAETPEKIEKSSTEGLNQVRQELLSKRTVLLTELEGARASLAVEELTARKLQARTADLTAMETTMRGLERDYMLAQEKYQNLKMKQSQAAISEATSKQAMPSMRVVEYATPPGSKWWPSLKILYPSALAVGLLLGMGAALIRSYSSGRIRLEDLERRLGAVPLYGTIPIAAGGSGFLVVLPRGQAAAVPASASPEIERS